MSLFGFGKKKENNISAPCRPVQNEKSAPATAPEAAPAQSTAALTSIKVLGSGCKNCHTLLLNTNKALGMMGFPFEAEFITDMAVVATYGVMSMPAIVANEKVISMGKVLNPAEVERLLRKKGY